MNTTNDNTGDDALSAGPPPSGPSGPTEPNRPNRRRKAWIFLALAAAVLVAAGVTTFVLVDRSTSPSAASESANPSAPSAEAEATTTTTVRGQQPGTVRLAQGGTARLVRREVTADGTLPIPEGLDEATWWGAGLGAPAGASVLAGHVNWKGAKGPFDELWRAEKGQRVEVVDTSGRRWTYQVSEIVTVHKDDLPARAEALFGQDGRHRLVLVTCGGDYVGGTDGYRDNRIVVAEPAA